MKNIFFFYSRSLPQWICIVCRDAEGYWLILTLFRIIWVTLNTLLAINSWSWQVFFQHFKHQVWCSAYIYKRWNERKYVIIISLSYMSILPCNLWPLKPCILGPLQYWLPCLTNQHLDTQEVICTYTCTKNMF